MNMNVDHFGWFGELVHKKSQEVVRDTFVRQKAKPSNSADVDGFEWRWERLYWRSIP